MNKTIDILPDYLFEVSWEVCNKVGGINTVIASKAALLTERFGDHVIMVGPDVWKETAINPAFTEDKGLLSSWREAAAEQGLYFRIGRWNIPGNPIAILVDFTVFFPEKDKILYHFWEKYHLDSTAGQWDYIEPVLFGYAAGKLIDSYHDFYLGGTDKVIAHFHEWLAASGILYLREHVPQAGLVFTTHATTVGRSLTGHGRALYAEMGKIKPEDFANEANIRSRFSLESTAARVADAFTTVSAITSLECRHLLGQQTDVLTPNGFNPSIPDGADLTGLRADARKSLLEAAGAVLGCTFSDETPLLLSSGRYEMRSKGLDLLIDSMAMINRDSDYNKELLLFIMVPADHIGPDPQLLSRLGHTPLAGPLCDVYTTHQLRNPDQDAIIQRLRASGIRNLAQDRVKVIFVPSYLNGDDGVFNRHYYDLLPGFDLSVFPSYYEPWGYTPHESIAYGLPTISSDKAGFGLWVRDHARPKHHSVKVMERGDGDYQMQVQSLKDLIMSYLSMDSASVVRARAEALKIAAKASWKEFVKHYFEAFSLALDKVGGRSELFIDKIQPERHDPAATPLDSGPQWKKVLVRTNIPDELSPLEELSQNLWWTWNDRAGDLFAGIDPDLWDSSQHNPIQLLEELSFDQLNELVADEAFMAEMRQVYEEFQTYLGAAASRKPDQIAYFSMEFGIHDSLKIYSGGLGVLAGDHLKEASDRNFNLIGIGLLYRYGYFKQQLTAQGEQVARYIPQKFSHMPMLPVRDEQGEWVVVRIVLPGRTLHAKVWKVDVGRIPLYLLDADMEENQMHDRYVTHQLYGGDLENRLKQELLLGVGGIRLLNMLGLSPAVYHCNEGHAAFIGLERMRVFIQERHLSYDHARELVRSSTLFTTHTPVPAGHDTFDEHLMRAYMPHYADRLLISWDDFMGLGRVHQSNQEEKFSMSVLAMKLSLYVNGVSRIHGRVSQKMFSELYPGYFPKELHIGYVTNGVHFPTWASREWKELYDETFGPEFFDRQSDPVLWERIYSVDDERIWDIRQKRKLDFIAYMRRRLAYDLKGRQENPATIVNTLKSLNPNALIVGFARRFATYKRAHLLFTDINRLQALVNDKERPVIFVFAGKAHPNDKAGQGLIQRIIEIARKEEFLGKVIFLENYDLELGHMLTQSVDIWLNNPTRPLEASGTSGEKAIMNGVLNFSVLDGWWAEGYRPEAGWALPEERAYEEQAFQDQLDAASIYNIFESEIIPLYYRRDENAVPHDWIRYIKNNIARIAPHYTMKRQLDDYWNNYYSKLIARNTLMTGDNFRAAAEMAAWKSKVLAAWPAIHACWCKVPDSNRRPLALGDEFRAEVCLETAGLSKEELRVELVFAQKQNDRIDDYYRIVELEAREENGELIYSCSVESKKSGVYDYAFRISPRHPLLGHRQDLDIVKWI
jgi:glycogen phosphorylase/synthase